jgi:hypothetical protein
MSNSAIKIIYNMLNSLDGIRCERGGAPDADFESLLRTEGLPLCTLESGIPLHEVDGIGFSIGYERGFTNAFGNVVQHEFIQKRDAKRRPQEAL